MKATNTKGSSPKLHHVLICTLVVECFILCATNGRAQPGPPGDTNYATPLASWSFNDTNHWTSDLGYAPVSFTNISSAFFGDYKSLVLNSNNPAMLRYNVVEKSGATNLTVAQGSVIFWFAPAWAGTNEGGTGPGQWGRLVEVGANTADGSFGWWSLLTDPAGANLYFAVQPGDGSTTTYLTAPVAWTTNYWHFIALTYCATNTALYLDGVLATNGPGITAWPGTNVLAEGFYIGSDSNGLTQAQGAFDDLYTYDFSMDSNAVYGMFASFYFDYFLSPWNMMNVLKSAPSSPSTNGPDADVITGAGNLQWVTNTANCLYGTSAYQVWITNVVATTIGSGTNNMVLKFSIQGGADGAPYDVFANSVSSFGTNGIPWAWMGQGYHCNTYLLTNLPNTACFLILGTPLDADGDGLTDAYENLVSKTDPHNYSTDGTGMSDGWEILYFGHVGGIDPNLDQDGDGLSNYQEFLMRSAHYNPTVWDSNTNSVSDGYEDYSGDGLANLMEAPFGGNMLTNNPTWKVDADGDGLPDLYETMAGSGGSGLPAYSKNPIP